MGPETFHVDKPVGNTLKEPCCENTGREHGDLFGTDKSDGLGNGVNLGRQPVEGAVGYFKELRRKARILGDNVGQMRCGTVRIVQRFLYLVVNLRKRGKAN